jgi:hypothetical protein
MLGRAPTAPRVRRAADLPDDGEQLTEADLKWVFATCDKMQCLFSAAGTGAETAETQLVPAAGGQEGQAGQAGQAGGEAPSRWAACADVIPRVLAAFDREHNATILREVAGIREYANGGRGGSAGGLQGVRALFGHMRGVFASRTIAIKIQMSDGMRAAGADRDTISAVERVSARYYVAIKALLDGIDGPASLAQPGNSSVSSRPPTTDEISATFRDIEAAGRAAQQSAARFREASAMFAKLEQALRTRSGDGKFMTFGGGFWRNVGKVARFVTLVVHDMFMWSFIAFSRCFDFDHMAALARLEMFATRLLFYGAWSLRNLSSALGTMYTALKSFVSSWRRDAIAFFWNDRAAAPQYDFTVMSAYVHNCITRLEDAADRVDVEDRAVKEGGNTKLAQELIDMLSTQPCNKENIERARKLVDIVVQRRDGSELSGELSGELKDWALAAKNTVGSPLTDPTIDMTEQSLLSQAVKHLRDRRDSPVARYLIARADLRPKVNKTHFLLIDMILRVGMIEHTYTPLILAMDGGRGDFESQYVLGCNYCESRNISKDPSWGSGIVMQEIKAPDALSPVQREAIIKLAQTNRPDASSGRSGSALNAVGAVGAVLGAILGGGSGAAASLRRSFTVVDASRGGKGGRYVSASPDGAAAKAARRRLKRGAADSMRLTVRETTRGATPAARNRLFAYAVDQKRLPKAVVRTLDGRTVRFTTQVTLHRV